ncbi:ABC transporter ATP-binding protein [Galbibacter sp.]|uniref:ABC transporter ATP-binding protein n=1 Tax=Galbibacter sp. TaxID=2918471 RepID=UPI002C208D23|nr:ABC transporter ATP-binding protein [Galbibacter sp.]HLV63826.1 ABC transporter ATP-binding protein [Galbibacter sp.]
MLKVHNVTFQYDTKVVLNNISLELHPGEHLSIIGESGSGKSTLLKIIYGLHHVEKGKLFWGKKRLLGPNYNLVPGEDFIKYLAQDYDLMPYITVEENVGKYLSNFYPRKKQKRIAELLNLVGLTAYAKTKPTDLSGGQQQRVAIAKALAQQPKLLLLDEPFSNIDNFKKNSLRRELFSYLKSQRISCITATHDNMDSLAYADKTMVLREGKIICFDDPKRLYKNPKNKYVASLFGEVNEILEKHIVPYSSSNKKIVCYPHQLQQSKTGYLVVKVKNSYFQGSHYLIESVLHSKTVFFNHHEAIQEGQQVSLKANFNA